MKPRDDHCFDRLIAARAALLLKYPFWGYICSTLKPVERYGSEGVTTFATDGEHLYYNPDFMRNMKRTAIMTVIAHEVGHCIFSHVFRRGDRDPRKWNIAGDYVINYLLKESGLEPVEGWLYDEKWAGMSTDEVFNRLDDNDCPKEFTLEGDVMDYDDKSQGGGDGDQDPKDGDQEGGSKKLSAKEREAMMKQRMANAAMQAKKQGKLPGSLESLIHDMLYPKVPWQQILRRFVEDVTTNDYSWRMPNKLFTHLDYFMPIRYSNEIDLIVISMDTSGSVSYTEKVKFATEISAILESVEIKEIRVIYCDADVQAVDTFGKGDLPLTIRDMGGGGTDFRPPFDYVEHHGLLPKCHIYMTDLCCSSYAPQPEHPVLWVTTPENAGGHWEKELPYGEVLVIDD